MARPRKAIRILPDLDVAELEAKIFEWVSAAADTSLAGVEKKKLVEKALLKWLDDVIRLPWYLEPFDRISLDLALAVVQWVGGAWIESVYLRFKSDKPVAKKAPAKAKG